MNTNDDAVDEKAELYTLRQAVLMLKIDYRTLQKRMKRMKIEPVDDPTDRRLRLLDGRQIRQLGQVPSRAVIPAPLLNESSKQWQEKLEHLQLRVVQLEDDFQKLGELQRRINRLERGLAELRSAMDHLKERAL